jgi:hypothetical protein
MPAPAHRVADIGVIFEHESGDFGVQPRPFERLDLRRLREAAANRFALGFDDRDAQGRSLGLRGVRV